MSNVDHGRTGGQALLTFAAAVVAIAGLKIASDLILPLLVATFLAMISLPLMTVLQTRARLPGGLAAVVAVLVELGLLAGVVALVGGSFRGFNEAAPRYQERLQSLAAQSLDWLSDRGVHVSRQLVADLLDPGMAFDLASAALKGVAGALSQTLIVALLILFVLLEAAGFPEKLEAAFGRRAASERYDRIRADVLKYLGIKTGISLLTGILVWASLALIGVDFPLVWGLFAFLLNYVPNLGSILAAVPPVLLALIQFGVGRAVAVAIVFVGINMVLGNLVEPRLMGRRLGLSTLVVFLSLIFWGWVWGPVGMLLSVPLTMILKIMLENTDDLRWVAVLLGDRPPPRAG